MASDCNLGPLMSKGQILSRDSHIVQLTTLFHFSLFISEECCEARLTCYLIPLQHSNMVLLAASSWLFQLVAPLFKWIQVIKINDSY